MRVKPTALRLWLAVCIVCIFSIASAQQKSVSGRVTDANNQPVAGASVVVKGTTTGTTSDEQGKFTITVPNDQSVLMVSSVGLDTKEVSVRGLNDVNVSLASNLSTLNEIVVTGYSSQRRKDITGSVAVVDVASMRQIPTGNPANALQGQASGVTILSSGQPGGPIM